MLLNFSLKAENTDLQDKVLNIANLTNEEINYLLQNYESNRDELLTTLTKNWLVFLEENYPTPSLDRKIASFSVYRLALKCAAYYLHWEVEENSSWLGVNLKAYRAIFNAGKSAGINEVYSEVDGTVGNRINDAARMAFSAAKKLELTFEDTEKAGWKLCGLLVLAYLGKSSDNNILTLAYNAAFEKITHSPEIGSSFAGSEDFIKHIAEYTWLKDDLAENSYIQSLLIFLKA